VSEWLLRRTVGSSVDTPLNILQDGFLRLEAMELLHRECVQRDAWEQLGLILLAVGRLHAVARLLLVSPVHHGDATRTAAATKCAVRQRIHRDGGNLALRKVTPRVAAVVDDNLVLEALTPVALDLIGGVDDPMTTWGYLVSRCAPSADAEAPPEGALPRSCPEEPSPSDRARCRTAVPPIRGVGGGGGYVPLCQCTLQQHKRTHCESGSQTDDPPPRKDPTIASTADIASSLLVVRLEALEAQLTAITAGIPQLITDSITQAFRQHQVQ